MQSTFHDMKKKKCFQKNVNWKLVVITTTVLILIITPQSSDAIMDIQSREFSHEWTEISSFAYLLQNIDIDLLAQAEVDLVIIDYSIDGTATGELTPEQVETIRSSKHPKKVLSYLSIGEAENYRYYWNDSWLTNPPEWLDEENPNWEGNYKVKYWHPEWQAIVLDYLDKIINQGFDGVYLDIIDAYEYYQDTVSDADIKMMNFVIKIAQHARNKTNNPYWGIFPQNAEELARNSTYLETISGIGREDVFLREDDSDTIRPPSELEPILTDLKRIKNAGKLVLTIDYTRNETLIRYVHEQAQKYGFIAYVTDRALNRLTIGYTTLLNHLTQNESIDSQTIMFDFQLTVLSMAMIIPMYLIRKRKKTSFNRRFKVGQSRILRDVS